MRFGSFAAGLLALALSAQVAHADGLAESTATQTSAPQLEPHPWLYLDDAAITPAMRATVFSRATYTGTGASPTRPFGADLAHPGAVVESGGEVGLLPWLSVAASGYTGTAAPTDDGAFGAMAGLRLAPFASAWKTTHLVMSGGVLRELPGGVGAWGRVALSQDIGRARLGATVHGEHVFAAGRDGIDVMAMAGASYGVAGPLRLGVEYVAQDVEETFGDAAERGMRHFVGPTAEVELLHRQLTIVGGPATGLSPGSPPLLARLGVAYAF